MLGFAAAVSKNEAKEKCQRDFVTLHILKLQVILKFLAHITLATIVLFQSSGLYLVHSIQLHFVRHEMKQLIKAGVPEEDLVLLKITEAEEQNPDIFEREHSREFRYRGEMYDVIRQHTVGDTTFYTCIHDVKESRLFDKLDRLVMEELNEDEDRKKQHDLAFNFFTTDYLPPAAEIVLNTTVSTKMRFQYSKIYSDKHLLDLLEPPRPMFLT